MTKRGFFGVGVWYSKFECNVGTLLRSAHAFGADFVFTAGSIVLYDRLAKAARRSEGS